VPTGPTRPPDSLRAGLARWVAAHPELVPGVRPGAPPPRLTGLDHADGGMANETLLIDLGPEHPGVVVRLPPLEATYADYDLAPQALMQNAVAAAGVPAPAPALAVTSEEWIGSPFLVMPRVRGQIPGSAPPFDPWVTSLGPAGQQKIHDGFIDTLVAIHAIDWSAHGLAAAYPPQSLGAALGRWSAYVAWAGEGEPLPALVEALAWCERHQPPDDEAPVLVWGDPRLGNLVYDESLAVHAVLDWDLAGVAPRGMDLGWHFGLEFMMGRLFDQQVPGFPAPAAVLARYESASGHTVTHLGWHEVFALVRALAINDRHHRIEGSRRRRENPMGEILLERMRAADSEV